MRVPVRSALVSCLVAAGACRFTPQAADQLGDAPGGGVIGGDAGSGSSAPHDAGSGGGPMADAPPVCYGGGPAMTCLDAPPTTAYPGGSLAVDTDSSPLCRSDVTLPTGGLLCVIAYTTISLDGIISAHGNRPLVIVSAGNVTIQSSGGVDVGSHGSGTPQALGPSANGACSNATPGSHGGGPGGSFGGLGGTGGTPNATPAIPGALVLTAALRGGCVGTDGDNTPGSHGDGGGAVAIVTNATLEIDGYIDASGGFGKGGDANNYGGGGGGGAGGMIEIAANSITGNGFVFVAGGGGGEGGENNGTPLQGHAGIDPSTSNLVDGAPGGDNGTNNGGTGGSGDGTSQLFPTVGNGGASGTGGTSHAGGGGGGGASGYLLVHAATTTGFSGTTLPPAIDN